ncbi:MAG: HNH endonuclease family protein [Candidatus Saccharimonadales bacterium]
MKLPSRRTWRLIRLAIALIVILVGTWQSQQLHHEAEPAVAGQQAPVNNSPAAVALTKLDIKGRAAKTGYSRAQFSPGWGEIGTCDVRNYILTRDLIDIAFVPHTCKVAKGTLVDPYTASTILFLRGPDTSDNIQIDHVVALSDAWQKGAQLLSPAERYALANDPLNLLAVQGDANQAKGDGDAATWLPANKAYRCPYVARQIAVKVKYSLWVTHAEYDAMANILRTCPEQTLPTTPAIFMPSSI